MACCGVRAQVMNTSGGITGRFSVELNSLENSAVWVGGDDSSQVRNGPFTKRRFMLKVVVFAKTGSGISQGRLPKQDDGLQNRLPNNTAVFSKDYR